MQKVTLKEISEFIRTGKTPPTKDTKYFNGEVQWFTPGDLDKSKFLVKSARTLTNLSFSDKKAAQYPSGTLLVACIGDIGKLGITRQKCSSNQQITGIKPKSNVDVSYLYYWFRYNKAVIQNTANNAVVPILNNKTLEQIKVPLLPLAEQQKIAAILDAADSLRQKDQQLVERYTALSQSLFLEMFGDPVTNQHGFEKGTIRDFISSANYGTSAKAQDGGMFPYLRMNNITYQGDMDFGSLKFINLAESEKPKYLVKKGDVLFNRTNSKELVGKTAIYAETAEMAIAGYLIRLRVNELANPYFIWGCLNSKHGKATLAHMCKSIVGMANINAQEVQNIESVLPPVSLQNQFAERIQLIEAQKQQAKLSLAKSEALFNSLLQRAFTGELTAKLMA